VAMAAMVSAASGFGSNSNIASPLCALVFAVEALGLMMMTTADSNRIKSELPVTREE